MKCNKTISIESRLLGEIEELINAGKVLSMSGFIENAVTNELERMK
jgi:metal-responsive CopG/Arc/MetJ family transcriptional regulator